MTATNPPPPDAGMDRAVEAAKAAWRSETEAQFAEGTRTVDLDRVLLSIIAAADRVRGRSWVTWRRPEEYEQSPSRWVFIRREWAIDRLPPETFHTGGNSLHPNVIAWAEMPAPPAWSETAWPSTGVLGGCLFPDACGNAKKCLGFKCQHYPLARTVTDGDRDPGPAPFSTEVAKALDFLSDYILGGEGVHDDLSEARAAFRLVDNHVRGKNHEPPGAAVLAEGGSFQAGVHKWLLACFGPEIAADKIERNHRFLEEALELVQAAGCTDSEAHQLVDYVFIRPVGEIEQEIGGVMNTLAALCLAHGLDMMDAGDKEMRRVWTMVEKIRAKQAAKPKHSPLPEHTLPAAIIVDAGNEAQVEAVARALHVDDFDGSDYWEQWAEDSSNAAGKHPPFDHWSSTKEDYRRAARGALTALARLGAGT